MGYKSPYLEKLDPNDCPKDTLDIINRNFCTLSRIYQRIGESEIGDFKPSLNSQDKDGWFYADGRCLDLALFPQAKKLVDAGILASKGSNGFLLPDLRGRFLRGVDDNSGRDPDRTERYDFEGNLVGDKAGSYQDHGQERTSFFYRNTWYEYSLLMSDTSIRSLADPGTIVTTSDGATFDASDLVGTASGNHAYASNRVYGGNYRPAGDFAVGGDFGGNFTYTAAVDGKLVPTLREECVEAPAMTPGTHPCFVNPKFVGLIPPEIQLGIDNPPFSAANTHSVNGCDNHEADVSVNSNGFVRGVEESGVNFSCESRPKNASVYWKIYLGCPNIDCPPKAPVFAGDNDPLTCCETCLVDLSGNPLEHDENGCWIIPTIPPPIVDDTCLVDAGGTPLTQDINGCWIIPDAPTTCLVDVSGNELPRDENGCWIVSATIAAPELPTATVAVDEDQPYDNVNIELGYIPFNLLCSAIGGQLTGTWTLYSQAVTAVPIATGNNLAGTLNLDMTPYINGGDIMNANYPIDFSFIIEYEVGDSCGNSEIAITAFTVSPTLLEHFTYVGTPQVATPPVWAQRAFVYAYGAAGGSRSGPDVCGVYPGGSSGGGGYGGYVEGEITTLASNYTIVVGEGGRLRNRTNTFGGGRGGGFGNSKPPSSSYAGVGNGSSGGGLTGMFTHVTGTISDFTQGNAILIAGGGGGTAADLGVGGNGSFPVGGNGSPGVNSRSGAGGTQSAGGNGPANGGNGSALLGGIGGNGVPGEAGGGGGGGYFGGGGGRGESLGNEGAGGGGSSYKSSGVFSFSHLTGATISSGEYYVSGIGRPLGGAGAGRGGHGRLSILWTI